MTPSPAASTSASDAGMLGRRVVMLPSAAAALGLRRGRARMRLGCVLEHVAPRLAVASAALLGAGEVIAAAGKSGGAGHAAVASTLAQLTVTAVAIASGACLSTKVDFLWPRIEQLPGSSLPLPLPVVACLCIWVFHWRVNC